MTLNIGWEDKMSVFTTLLGIDINWKVSFVTSVNNIVHNDAQLQKRNGFTLSIFLYHYCKKMSYKTAATERNLQTGIGEDGYVSPSQF